MPPLAIKTLGGDGPDIVLLHGFGSDRLSWLGTSPALLPLGRVHAIDMPAHGEFVADVGSGHPDELAERLRETLLSHGVGRPHLIGHSLGGGLALLLAAANPEHIASLALISPLGLGRGVDRSFLTEFPTLSEADTAMTLLRRLVARPVLINKLMVQRTLAQLDKPGVRDAVKKIAEQAIAHEQLLSAAADRVASHGIPRLVLWGAADGINPPNPERLAAFGGSSQVIAETGHLPQVESPAVTNAALAEFLRQAIAG